MNSGDDVFAEVAAEYGVGFHKRPAELANHTATTEQFVYEFLSAHPCDCVFQVQSIAPLLFTSQIAALVARMAEELFDSLLPCAHEPIKCAYEDSPIDFSFDKKTNSQESKPVQRISWSITGWRRTAFSQAVDQGRIAQVHSASTQWKPLFNLGIYMRQDYLSVNGIRSSTRSYGDETISVPRKRFDKSFAMGKPNEEIIYFEVNPSWELEITGFLDNVVKDTPVIMGNAQHALKAMLLVTAITRTMNPPPRHPPRP